MINFIKNDTPITICDIGASSIDKTKLDTVFKENLEQIKNSLKKTTRP